MKKFLASRGVGGALGGWGAPLAVAPGAALPWWRNPPPPIDNAQLIASSGAVPTSEPTSRPALRRVRRGFGPSNSPGDGNSSTASITLAFAPASRAASIAVIASMPASAVRRIAVPVRHQVQLLCPQGVRTKMGKSKMPRGTAHMTAVRPVARRRRCEAARGFTPDHPCRSACAAVTDIARLPKSKWESYPPPLRRIQLPLGLGA